MRIRTLTAATAVLAVLPLAACGSDSDDDSASGGWTYTDGRGETIELDEAPDTIVAQVSMAAALADLGVDGVVGAFGPRVDPDGEPDPQAGDVGDDVEDVTGGAYGDVLTEDIAKLGPDLLVTMTYDGDALWYLNDKPAETLGERYGLVVQSYEDRGLVGILDDTEELAEALGADLDSEEVTQAHEDFEAAADRLRDIGERLGDRQIVAISALPDTFYVSNPEKSNDLKYYRDELGLPIVTPELTAEDSAAGGYFAALSLEEADTYAGDIALWDARVGQSGLDLIKGIPTWATTPAAQADAYVRWDSVLPPSYRAQADAMNQIADELEKYL